jgi:protein TonB
MTRSPRRGSRLRTYYVLYVELGLALALFLLVTAARAPLSPSERAFQVDLQTQEIVRMAEITQTRQQSAPPPPPRAPVPVEVPNNTVIEQQDLDFDASLDLSAALDTTMGPPTPNDPTPTATANRPDGEIFVVVEQEPELIGGMAALQRAVDYPEFARQAGIQGRVFVQFVVDEAGQVQDPHVTRGVHKLLDEEALRAIKAMSFRPGKQRGNPVKVRLTLPVNFVLQSNGQSPPWR